MDFTDGCMLDTNVLVHLIRDKAVGRAVDARFGLTSAWNRSVISVVVVGEVLSLARRLNWGANRLETIRRLLDEIVWVDVGRLELLDAYAEIDAVTTAAGRPMGKNDVWIAATAHVARLPFLTMDYDFAPLAPHYLPNLVLIDPDTGAVLPQ